MSVGSYNPGDIFMGRYRIERVLGSGNMGLVVSATHIGLDQRVAIKFMLPGKAPTEQHQRFLREARACAKLKTQHVAKALDVGSTPEGAPYMVMEFLDGRDLAAELAARGPLPIAEAVEYVLQACEAVAEAHAAGIVHRDIKPANLFLTRGADGAPCVKVLDFGISKMGGGLALTSDMQALGSPLYMSPEQMDSAKDVDARADVWALGVTLYELVAGLTPFHAERIEELCTRIYLKPPTPLSTYRTDAPRGFESVLVHCLEKDRGRRFSTVAALAAALVPYGGQDAARHAHAAAALLGEQVVPARPTDVLPPEPTLGAPRPVAPEAGTGAAVVRPASKVSPGTPRGGVAFGVTLGLGAVGLTAAGLVAWRLHTAPPGLPAPASAPVQPVMSAPPAAATSAPPPTVTPAPDGTVQDAGAAPLPAPSTAMPTPKTKAPAAPRLPPVKTAAEAPGPAPTAKRPKDPYAQ
jgi:serine/threonine-protein kinase